MPKLIRRLAVASFVAAGLTLIPVSVSSVGTIETNEACASGNCKDAVRGMCIDSDGTPIYNARSVVG